MSENLLNLLRYDSFGSVQETLHFWLEECSIDEAPDAAELTLWQDILQKRGGRFAELAERCRVLAEEIR